MNEAVKNEKTRSYCAQCSSQCPIVCHIENEVLVKVSPDKEHPNATTLCPKGLSAPELVYNQQRLKYPLRRTRPKGDKDPGWKRITWDEAMETIASKLKEIKARYGAQSIVFNRPGPGGSPAEDFAEWVIRLAYIIGTPNVLATGHVCQWHRDTGSKYTYGMQPVIEPEFDKSNLVIIWGHNPFATRRINVRDITQALSRGAKLLVIDPRRTEIAEKADLWLQIRPGTDGALILSLISVLLKEELYDKEFIREWTNAPFLVRKDTGNLLKAEDLGLLNCKGNYVVWDTITQTTKCYNPELIAYENSSVKPALDGKYSVKLATGETVEMSPVFQLLSDLAFKHSPAQAEAITGIKAEKIEKAARMIGSIKPSCYYTYNGIEQHTNAMQTNRALCILYSLAGNYDSPGGSVIFPTVANNPIRDKNILPPEMHKKFLGFEKRPLGPAGYPGSSIQAYEVFESILSEKPYPIKAMVAFGGNIITANSHSGVGRDALIRLGFYAHADLFMNPSAELADIVLPASTLYESYHLRMGFRGPLKARCLVQWRPQVIKPLYESRPDMEIIFDLAKRMGLDDKFWNGDVEAGFKYQLSPSGLSLEDIKRKPGGVELDLPLEYKKYGKRDPLTRKPAGFKTPSKKLEIFSQLFKDYGYDPLPVYQEPTLSPVSRRDLTRDYPLILTASKLIYYSNGQHRAVPSLRKAAPYPFVEINHEKAQELNIKDGEWVRLETPDGGIKLMAKLTDKVAPDVVCIQHGWWQSCPELNLPGYDPYSAEGANANLLYSTKYIDAISGSVPYKAYLCRLRKI